MKSMNVMAFLYVLVAFVPRQMWLVWAVEDTLFGAMPYYCTVYGKGEKGGCQRRREEGAIEA